MVDQLTLQPFFDSLGQPAAPHAAAVNAAPTARLERILRSPVDAPGRGILLRAPRAGFGKTHLLAQVQQHLGTTHEFLPLNPLDGSRTDAPSAIEAALRRLTRQLPAGGGLTALDLQARRLFSLALQPLVSSGEVPCQDREAALTALRQRPVETFDFHHAQAVTAHWTKENFEVLGPRLALELSRRTGSSLNESSFWLASLFRYAIAVPEHPGRTGMIIQSATSDAGVERYAALLAMLSLIGRVVIAADDLEGMHSDRSAALRFASFLASARQDAPRVDVVVSLNDDIWESAFVPALSGGLQDRLGEVEIRLEPLDQASALALLEARMPGRATALAHRLGLTSGEFYARRVLRKASEMEEESGQSAAPLLTSAAAVVPAAAAVMPAAEPAVAVVVPEPEPAPEPTPTPAPAPVELAPEPEPEPPPFQEVVAPLVAAAVATPAPVEARPVSPFEEVAASVPAPAAVSAPTEDPAIPEATASPFAFASATPAAATATIPPASPPGAVSTVNTDAAKIPSRRPEQGSPFASALDFDLDEPVPSPAPIQRSAPAAAAPVEAAPPAAATPFTLVEDEEKEGESAPPASGPPPIHWPKSDSESSAAQHEPESAEPVAAHSGGDRIDDLLRQFRERYGRE